MTNQCYNKLKPLLEIRNFSYSFSNHLDSNVVSDVNFCLYPNEFIGIIGESGSGKSVTAKAILQLNSFGGKHSPESKIIYGGENLLTLKEEKIRKIRGREIGIVFQDPMTYLNPTATIGSQIGESLAHHFPHYTKQDVYNKTLELISVVELSNPELIYRNYPHELSGGMRQRVMIAIALAPKPRIFIADEITTALDVTIQHEILYLLKKLQKTLAMSIIFITHDLSIISNFASVVLVMYKGALVECGRTEIVCNTPAHPYTKALIDAIPKINMDKNSRLDSIKTLREPSKRGCIFYDKCKNAKALCNSIRPLHERDKKSDEGVTCHFPMREEKKEETLCPAPQY